MNIPWGPIMIAGGLAIIYGTDWPGIIGWVLVGFGIFSTVLTLLVMLLVAFGVWAASSTPKASGLTKTPRRRIR